MKVRRHLLENLDDNPADGTEKTSGEKKKSALPTYILFNHSEPIFSGPLHTYTST